MKKIKKTARQSSISRIRRRSHPFLTPKIFYLILLIGAVIVGVFFIRNPKILKGEASTLRTCGVDLGFRGQECCPDEFTGGYCVDKDKDVKCYSWDDNSPRFCRSSADVTPKGGEGQFCYKGLTPNLYWCNSDNTNYPLGPLTCFQNQNTTVPMEKTYRNPWNLGICIRKYGPTPTPIELSVSPIPKPCGNLYEECCNDEFRTKSCNVSKNLHCVYLTSTYGQKLSCSNQPIIDVSLTMEGNLPRINTPVKVVVKTNLAADNYFYSVKCSAFADYTPNREFSRLTSFEYSCPGSNYSRPGSYTIQAKVEVPEFGRPGLYPLYAVSNFTVPSPIPTSTPVPAMR
ncbi:hypothetical protein A2960_02890 [Candidatus Gottesmanbacteria bacterium RIFCSPLOWO2_01_FULL_39_12b]|uniref:Uncharacterized protein n=1 Tax=Candidatus Gottesmanbacteria bacterium RIFCSPLOWO2_01_FULL_39_12b TaxID=1798388 RepID=A0A1F6AQW2_9BACT|nr:MAG: hypothetical protein A2960_02890 [Candidatus Gottesmanbacteria bacterium RIFCSPLOWO2_01_FULL_39_12b]